MSNPTKLEAASIGMFAGIIAGEIETVMMWPAEYIKTQLQLQQKLPVGQSPKFTGMLSGVTYTVSNHGPLALYNGSGIALLMNPIKTGIRFGMNSYLKELLVDENGKLSPLRNFMAGLGAGVTEALIAVTPMETIKTKLIQSNQNLVSGMSQIFRNEGIGGFYQGTSATVLKQGSNQALRFMFMNEYKSKLKEYVGNKSNDELGTLSILHTSSGITTVGSLVGGMGAGCFGVICNNPFDVVKTRMQGTDASRYKSTADCFVQIIKQEGFKGYYRGALTRMVRVVPGQGITFAAVDFFKPHIAKTFFNKNM